MAYSSASIEGLGDGVFRKVRRALGVTAFGVNAMVLPPGTEWFEHYHEHQDELYFVHAGKADSTSTVSVSSSGQEVSSTWSRRPRGASGTRATET